MFRGGNLLKRRQQAKRNVRIPPQPSLRLWMGYPAQIMKLLTYSSYGGNVPTAVENKARELGCNIRADKRLVAFVESFTGDQPPRKLIPEDQEYLAQHQAELLPTSVIKTGDDGITRQSFLGYTLNKHGFSSLTRVTVNEYDEAITKVIIEEHDGAETLVPLLEPKPDPQIPGLYHW